MILLAVQCLQRADAVKLTTATRQMFMINASANRQYAESAQAIFNRAPCHEEANNTTRTTQPLSQSRSVAHFQVLCPTQV